MRVQTQKFPQLIVVLMIAAFFLVCVRVTSAQEPPPQGQPIGDLIEQLRLTPEQRQKIRAIREESKNERAAINQRVRATNIALQQALDADNPNEALVEQRLQDAAAAQAAAMRMRIQTEVKIRRVLTQEQIAILRGLRSQAQTIREQQNQRVDRRGDLLRRDRRNGIAPLLPRRRRF